MHNEISLRHGMEQMIFWITDNPMGAWRGQDPQTIQKEKTSDTGKRYGTRRWQQTCKKQ